MTPLAPQRTPFPPPPAEWPALPTQEELAQYGFFPIPGIDYCWVLHANQPAAARSADAWSSIARMPIFRVAGHDVVLLASGEPIPGGTLEDCSIRFYVDPDLEKLLGGSPLDCDDAPRPVGRSTVKR